MTPLGALPQGCTEGHAVFIVVLSVTVQQTDMMTARRWMEVPSLFSNHVCCAGITSWRNLTLGARAWDNLIYSFVADVIIASILTVRVALIIKCGH